MLLSTDNSAHWLNNMPHNIRPFIACWSLMAEQRHCTAEVYRLASSYLRVHYTEEPSSSALSQWWDICAGSGFSGWHNQATNVLNLKLQGYDKVLPVLVNDVSTFKEKLSLDQHQLGASDSMQFLILYSQSSQLHSVFFQPGICVVYLNELSAEFKKLFLWLKSDHANDLCGGKPVQHWCECSFTVLWQVWPFENLKMNSLNRKTKKPWSRSIKIVWDITVAFCAKKILMCLELTCQCESACSTMGNKSKQGYALNDKHMHDSLRTATFACQPDLGQLVANMQIQVSH